VKGMHGKQHVYSGIARFAIKLWHTTCPVGNYHNVPNRLP
jgi:hypothetical protein